VIVHAFLKASDTLPSFTQELHLNSIEYLNIYDPYNSRNIELVKCMGNIYNSPYNNMKLQRLLQINS